MKTVLSRFVFSILIGLLFCGREALAAAKVAPSIKTQPVSVTATVGQAVTFTVVATTTPPTTYQWRKGGVAIAGATDQIYKIPSVVLADAGQYTVYIKDSQGTTTSKVATLTVNAAPVPPTLSTQPVGLTVTAGQVASFSVVAAGSIPLAYQWLKDGTTLEGATAATYSIPTAFASDAGAYSVTVTNSAGTVTSTPVTLTVNVPPSISAQPASVTVNLGQGASFSVAAAGTALLTYQWKKDSTAIAGATGATYALANTAASDAGSYSVSVSNVAGTVTSTVATLAVITPPIVSSQPMSLTVNAGQAASFGVVAAGTAPFTYQWLKDSRSISGATAATYSLASVSAADAGDYSVTVTNPAGLSTSSAAHLTVVVPPAITTQPVAFSVVAGRAASFSVVATGTAPLTYQWKKDGSAIGGATSAVYSIQAATTADAASYSVTITNAAGSVTSESATLAVLVPPTVSTQPVAMTANSGKAASFSVVAAGTAPFTYQWLKEGVAISGATSATFSIGAVTSADAGGYSVMITNAAGTITSTTAALVVVLPPVINTQPISLTIITGKSASFSVGATSTVAFTYQWNKNGVAIAGASGATYSIAATAATDAGAYSVTVSNSAGSVVSSAATLTVAETPTYNRMCTTSVRSVITATKTSAVVGFTTEGVNTRRLLVRGVGPSLAQYGVTNVLAQPKIEVHTKVNGVDTVLASNTQWSDEPKAAQAFIEAGAFAFDAGSKDVAIVIELAAGAYTVVLSGVNGSVGTALVEIYELP